MKRSDQDHVHKKRRPELADESDRERTAALFRALSDAERLKIIELLAHGEWCVSELAEAVRGDPATLSQRLRVLRNEGLVSRRRSGRHIFYRLSDEHVAGLVRNGFAHAREPERSSRKPKQKGLTMANEKKDHKTHDKHDHKHGKDCGHKTVEHEGHKDYLHDGHLHHVHEGHVDEHAIAATKANPADCTPKHACDAHDAKHVHGNKCGHEKVPHADHADYLVDGHLHHKHEKHCDDHGKIEA